MVRWLENYKVSYVDEEVMCNEKDGEPLRIMISPDKNLFGSKDI